jgi:DNA-binding response OmpR family regulator
MHILVAEDDRDIADLVSHYVTKTGWSAHIAGAGDAALAYARSHAVDAIVLDLMLPDMDASKSAGPCVEIPAPPVCRSSC